MSYYQHALHLASLGFHVFPVTPNGKIPAIEAFPVLASRDRDVIKRWWFDPVMELEQPYNIGISTSKFGDDECLVAVDVDNKDGKDGDGELLRLELEGKDLPPTYVQFTPTGGRHFVYRTKETLRQGVNKLGIGLDIRARGGYLVGAGSSIKGGVYTSSGGPPAISPDWLVSSCGRSTERQPSKTENIRGVDTVRAKTRAIEYLELHAPESVKGSGGDQTAFIVAAKLKDLGVPREECLELMFEHWFEGSGWSPEKLQIKIDNAFSYGHNSLASDAPEAQFTPIAPLANPMARTFKFEHYSEIKPDFSKRPLVQHLLDPGGVSIVYAEPNNGKSWFANELCHSIAMGMPFLGKKTQKAAVIYVVGEGAGGFRKRIAAYQKSRNILPTQVPFFMIDEPIQILNDIQKDTSALIETISVIAKTARLPVGLIVLDTLARVMGKGDENKADDMQTFNNRITRIAKETGSHVMVIHHSGKDATKGARGHSSLNAAVDTAIKVEKVKGVFTAFVTKQRDQDIKGPLAFTLQSVWIGDDIDGEPVESCVVVPALVPNKATQLNKTALSAFKCLQTLALNEGPFDKPKPVNLEEWREAFIDDFYNGKANSSGRSAFTRAQKELLQKGKIEIQKDMATIIGSIDDQT